MAITNRTTVKQLKEMGVTDDELQALVVKAQKRNEREELQLLREQFAEEIFQLMLENPEAEWKNGLLLKQYFPNGKSSDEEVESARVKKHQEISRALQSLAEQGLITKHQGKTTATTHYTIVSQTTENSES